MSYTTHRGKRVSPSHAKMLYAYEKVHGPVYINQGARTLAEQARFYSNYLRYGHPLAARPWGGAPHIKWKREHHALDINSDIAQKVAAFYRSHGVPVAFNVRGEPWHMDTLDESALVRAAQKLETLPIIKKGSQGPAVQKLQVYLRAAGYLPSRWHVHQKYTLTVRRAVRKLQKDHGLRVDGVVGSNTWEAVGAKRR